MYHALFMQKSWVSIREAREMALMKYILLKFSWEISSFTTYTFFLSCFNGYILQIRVYPKPLKSNLNTFEIRYKSNTYST